MTAGWSRTSTTPPTTRTGVTARAGRSWSGSRTRWPNARPAPWSGSGSAARGGKPVMGADPLAPLAGLVGGPPGTEHDGHDAVWTFRTEPRPPATEARIRDEQRGGGGLMSSDCGCGGSAASGGRRSTGSDRAPEGGVGHFEVGVDRHDGGNGRSSKRRSRDDAGPVAAGPIVRLNPTEGLFLKVRAPQPDAGLRPGAEPGRRPGHRNRGGLRVWPGDQSARP